MDPQPRRATSLTNIAALVAVPILVAWLTSLFTLQTKRVEKESDVKIRMIELSLDILKTAPEELGSEGLRIWAAKILQDNSSVGLDPDALDSLLRNPLKLNPILATETQLSSSIRLIDNRYEFRVIVDRDLPKPEGLGGGRANRLHLVSGRGPG